ncbi:PLP-dependent aminotransferase family protein [Catellatospora chokoriensis]|uniref:aminotransferase-like domain-containing protein n=1 Tax=Catellatospora chokoriensis TaxID=310353 RepID=UPI0017815BB8|nr:PLP-dependent aminotransferase family protein [Catellatospora chokoriensis]
MSESSTYDGLIATLRALLSTMAPGERMPSSRDLVEQHRISPATVARAIALLAAEGAVVTRPGSGTYVAPRPRQPTARADTGWQTVALTDRTVDTRSVIDDLGPPPEGTIRFDGGYPHASLRPTAALSAALGRAGRRPGAWDRAPAAGLGTLRSLFATSAGGTVTADDVLVTAGGQSALSMALRAVAAPGSPILVESPTYPGVVAAARAAGLRPVPVPVDGDGLRPGLLSDAFAMTGARVLYCQPNFHNPTGAVLPPQRRREFVDIARAAGAFVIEDDFSRFLTHGRAVPAPLAADDRDGTVVQVTSLTKPAAPSLRIGAIVARGPVMARIRAVRLVDDAFIARPLQEAAVDLLTSPAWDRHLRGLAAALRDRCRVLADALGRECPEWTVTLPEGGLHLWAALPSGSSEQRLALAARELGVAVNPGRKFFAAEPPGAFLRLSFAAAADTAELVTGARLLAQADA